MRINTQRPGDNEGKACDAVLRILEAREKTLRSEVHRPEKEKHAAPVELVCRIGSQEFALEHTLIEAYPNQIKHDVQFEKMLECIEDQLSGSLPKPGHYSLVVTLNAFEGLKQHEIPKIQRRVTKWVSDTAPKLQTKPPCHYTKEVLPEVSFEISLFRFAEPPEYDGKLIIARSAHDNLEPERRQRIRETLNAKCPKLHEWKSNGAVSVLILETTDIALSNHVVIAESVGEELRGRCDAPDEIYLVGTVCAPWTIWTLKRGNALWPNVDDGGHVAVDPNDLDDTTN